MLAQALAKRAAERCVGDRVEPTAGGAARTFAAPPASRRPRRWFHRTDAARRERFAPTRRRRHSVARCHRRSRSPLPRSRRDAPLASLAHRLLDDTDAAIARQTLLQVASLPIAPTPPGARIDPSMPRWNFEVPFATPAWDGDGGRSSKFRAMGRRATKVEAGSACGGPGSRSDVEPAGPFGARADQLFRRAHVGTVCGGGAAGDRRAIAPMKRGRTRPGPGQAELQPGDIVIREGAPPQPSPAKAGHFLDRAL